MFFSLPSWALALLILAVIGGASLAGYAGVYLREHHETLREPFGVLQAALLGLVGLVLAFRLWPTRGLIRVPDTPLVQLRASTALPPAS